MTVPSRSPGYRSYLLRFWHESAASDEQGTWRFMLEDPHTGERHGFADFQNLIGHLRQLMNQSDTQHDAQYNSQTDPTPAQNGAWREPGNPEIGVDENDNGSVDYNYRK